MSKLSTEHKEKLSESAIKRWQKIERKELAELRQAIRDGMRNYWASKTPEERTEIARKAAATRRANRLAGGKK